MDKTELNKGGHIRGFAATGAAVAPTHSLVDEANDDMLLDVEGPNRDGSPASAGSSDPVSKGFDF